MERDRKFMSFFFVMIITTVFVSIFNSDGVEGGRVLPVSSKTNSVGKGANAIKDAYQPDQGLFHFGGIADGRFHGGFDPRYRHGGSFPGYQPGFGHGFAGFPGQGSSFGGSSVQGGEGAGLGVGGSGFPSNQGVVVGGVGGFGGSQPVGVGGFGSGRGADEGITGGGSGYGSGQNGGEGYGAGGGGGFGGGEGGGSCSCASTSGYGGRQSSGGFGGFQSEVVTRKSPVP